MPHDGRPRPGLDTIAEFELGEKAGDETRPPDRSPRTSFVNGRGLRLPGAEALLGRGGKLLGGLGDLAVGGLTDAGGPAW